MTTATALPAETNTANHQAPLGQRLTRALRLRGMSRVQLQKTTGLDRATIFRIEHDANNTPHAESIRRICAALDITSDWLLYGDDATAPTNEPENTNDVPLPITLFLATAARTLPYSIDATDIFPFVQACKDFRPAQTEMKLLFTLLRLMRVGGEDARRGFLAAVSEWKKHPG